MTKQDLKEFEFILLTDAANRLLDDTTENLSKYVFQFHISDKWTVRDVRKDKIIREVEEGTPLIFARDIKGNLDDLKFLKKVIEKHNLDVTDYKLEIDCQLEKANAIKRAAEPILENYHNPLKAEMSSETIEKYQKILKGWKFITK